MKFEERERKVDRLLDEALGPQAVEPRPGLEQRILAGLQAQRQPRLWRQWAWALMAAALIIAIGVYVTRRPQPAALPVARVAPSVMPVVTAKPQPQPVASRSAKRPIRRPAAPAVAAVMNPTPRLETFPSRTPITPEEQLLRIFVQRQLRQAQQVAAAQAAREERVRKFFDTGEIADNGHGGISK